MENIPRIINEMSLITADLWETQGVKRSVRLVWLGPYHRRRKGSVVGGTMASVEHEPITGVWGRAPAWSRGRAPGQGVWGVKPPETDSILVVGCPTEPTSLAPVRENSMVGYGPLLSELGAQSAWCPNPVIGGPVPPGLPPAPPPIIHIMEFRNDTTRRNQRQSLIGPL